MITNAAKSVRFLKKRFFSKISASVVAVNSLSESNIETMHKLMNTCYTGLSRENFKRDLEGKSHVIVINETVGGKIVGFSTLKTFSFQIDGIKSIGVFSGDTVVAKQYWGNVALQIAFLKHLCTLKWKNRDKKIYWFLISKGYKTFLLMANNFSNYYPSKDTPTPEPIAKAMNEVYQQLFPGRWQNTTGIIKHGEEDYALTEGVAAPSQRLHETNENVKFFVENNPGWEEGDELACMAEMSYSVLTNYLKKKLVNMAFGHDYKRIKNLKLYLSKQKPVVATLTLVSVIVSLGK